MIGSAESVRKALQNLKEKDLIKSVNHGIYVRPVIILLAILRDAFNISGFRNKNMQKLLGFNGGKISRLIKRLRIHGLIKKATNSYKYYLTKIGKETI